ncbi:MAG TPA: catalase family protein [Actinomycetota bacterium]|nr:catalase family protein [Actinomycetota bacterium]
MQDAFVKYTPALEQADPDFDRHLQTVIEETKKYEQSSVEAEGLKRAVRDAHAKGYGLARAEVEILAGLAPEYAQGVYALPGRHEALIRFSNGSAHAGADALLGNPVGMGLKLLGIDGQTLLEDEPDSHTFDYALINAPIFFCNTVEHYLFIQQLFLHFGAYVGKQGQHQFLHDWVTGKDTLAPEDWAWDELLAFLSILQRVHPVNLLLSTYWTMGAVRHGEYVAKVRVAPRKESAEKVVQRLLDPASAPDIFRPALVAELKERPYEFELQVQLCLDLEKMPVEDLTVEWPEPLSPFVTVARVRLPQQDISGDDNLEEMDATSITPWRCPEEHRPLGNLMRMRKEVYRQSSILRHALNHQIRREPKSLADVFGKVHA